MASNRLLWACVALALLGGCKRGPSQAEQDSIAQADLAARRDSLRKVKATRDSVAAVAWTACVDSLRHALNRTAAGRRTLAKRVPAGQPRPENVAACGAMPAPLQVAATTAAVNANAGGAAPAGPTPAAAPAQTPASKPAATPAAPAGPTPQQQRVARADSVRQARERARADSAARLAERQRADSMTKVAQDSVRADSLARARETEVLRESFSYAGARRDPFQSILAEGTTGPDIDDMDLVSILYDVRSARNSVAIFREKTGPRRWRVRVGEKIGTATVTLITPHDVNFSIQDFGFERQETKSLHSPQERTP